jgi:hypothetical protein
MKMHSKFEIRVSHTRSEPYNSKKLKAMVTVLSLGYIYPTTPKS